MGTSSLKSTARTAFNRPAALVSQKHRARSHEHMSPPVENRDHAVHTTTTSLSSAAFTHQRPHTLENHLTVLNGGTPLMTPSLPCRPHTQSQATVHTTFVAPYTRPPAAIAASPFNTPIPAPHELIVATAKLY